LEVVRRLLPSKQGLHPLMLPSLLRFNQFETYVKLTESKSTCSNVSPKLPGLDSLSSGDLQPDGLCTGIREGSIDF
jgi:hypothetical protein